MKANQQPRPYSAYTIYWRLERIHILQSSGYLDEETRTFFDPEHYDALEHPRPAKYENIMLPPFWYSSVHRKNFEKKRKHRKQEGSISKADLTAMISKSWREIDPEIHQYCTRLANAEKMKWKILENKQDKANPSNESCGSIVKSASHASQVKPGNTVIWPSSICNPSFKRSEMPELPISSDMVLTAAAPSPSVLNESILEQLESDTEFQEFLDSYDERLEASFSSADFEDDFNHFCRNHLWIKEKVEVFCADVG